MAQVISFQRKVARFLNKLAKRGPVAVVKILAQRALAAAADLFWTIEGIWSKRGLAPTVRSLDAKERTRVDQYWNRHTVNSKPFKSANQSRRYLDWRFSIYPLFKEFMDLYSPHESEVVMDYGCGPGDDVTGFAIYSQARKIIGIDISAKALSLARERLALHHVDPERVQLIKTSDSVAEIPLPDSSVDYIQSGGVLHHTSDPGPILSELYRILKPGHEARVMVYNRNSVFFHLYIAYEKMLVEKVFPEGMTVYEAFSRGTDGPDCPISRCYTDDEWISICDQAGFKTEYVGGYLSDIELGSLKKYRDAALSDSNLSEEHKSFIRTLTVDDKGLPKYHGKHAGVGGVYRLYKR